jgi:hypothetical protein
VRLATPHDIEAEANQIRQIEKHMHVCLDVYASFKTVATIAALEPILSKAADKLIQ